MIGRYKDAGYTYVFKKGMVQQGTGTRSVREKDLKKIFLFHVFDIKKRVKIVYRIQN